MRQHWLLESEIHFLNHGSFGACPRVVLEFQSRLRLQLEQNPVRFMLGLRPQLMQAARQVVADYVHASPEDLAFTHNATSGVNAVLRSLVFTPDDELLTTNHTYGACYQALRFACERSGARLVVAEVPYPLEDPRQVTEALLAKVTTRTRLALVDHVTSLTGLILPIEEIVRELKARGIETLVDGAHAFGMLELDLDALGAGYYAANFHKWGCSPKGAAALWVRRELQPHVYPGVISHGYGAGAEQRFAALFDWVGTDDPTACLSVPEALRFMGELWPGGWPELRARNRALASQARELLCKALEQAPASPDSMLGSLVTLLLPSSATAGVMPHDPLYRELARRGFETVVMPWAEQRVLRVTTQAYNTLTEYEELAQILPEVVASTR